MEIHNLRTVRRIEKVEKVVFSRKNTPSKNNNRNGKGNNNQFKGYLDQERDKIKVKEKKL